MRGKPRRRDRMNRELESKIETYLEELCKERGWICQKAAAVGSSGFPDRIIVTNTGQVTFCELKRPNEKPRKLQIKMFLKPLFDHNASVVVVSDKNQADELIKQLEKGLKPEPNDETTFYIKPLR
jgi:hypothetical protein